MASRWAYWRSSSVSASSRSYASAARASRSAATFAYGCCGVSTPSAFASRGTAWAPASSWKPPLLALTTWRTSGVPGTGRKPTSPAPPVKPRCSLAVDDEGGAEALLVPQQDEVLVAAGGAEALLGDGDQIDVVLVLHRHRQERGQLVQQGGGVPAGQVRGVPQPSGARVEGARRADDEPVDVGAGEPGVLHRPVQRVGDLAHHAVGAAGPGSPAPNSPTVRPVTSATAATMRRPFTSSPATWAARAFTV